MLWEISRNWWLLALRGTLAVVFGAVAFVWPGITFEVLVLLFGAYAFVDGVLMLSYGLLAAGEHENGWPLALGGIRVFVVAPNIGSDASPNGIMWRPGLHRPGLRSA